LRKVILSGVILASAVSAALAIGIPAASAATPSFPDNVCIPNSSGDASQCWNDWDGNLTAGSPAVRFYHYGNSGGYNAIDVQYVGQINTSSTFQPFSDGSDLNDRYNKDNVYKFAWWRDNEASDICVAGYGANQNAVNAGCNLSSGEDVDYFVWTSYSDLVSVGASNALFNLTRQADQPVWAGSNGKGNVGNGDNVFLTTTQDNNLPYYFYNNGG
jgi:hypothetical protein